MDDWDSGDVVVIDVVSEDDKLLLLLLLLLTAVIDVVLWMVDVVDVSVSVYKGARQLQYKEKRNK